MTMMTESRRQLVAAEESLAGLIDIAEQADGLGAFDMAEKLRLAAEGQTIARELMESLVGCVGHLVREVERLQGGDHVRS